MLLGGGAHLPSGKPYARLSSVLKRNPLGESLYFITLVATLRRYRFKTAFISPTIFDASNQQMFPLPPFSDNSIVSTAVKSNCFLISAKRAIIWGANTTPSIYKAFAYLAMQK